MRYIVAVDVRLHNQFDDSFVKVVTWKEAVRSFFADPRVMQAADVYSIMDLRRALMNLEAGGWAAVNEETLAAILPYVRRPGMQPEFVYSGEAFFRAFTEAGTKQPDA